MDGWMAANLACSVQAEKDLVKETELQVKKRENDYPVSSLVTINKRHASILSLNFLLKFS